MTAATNNPQEIAETYSTPTIGIIYPPPELRNIVDKTAHFVARNGTELESRIRQHEAGNPKFDFLKPQNPYNAYYLHKVMEFTEKPDAQLDIVTPQVSTVTDTPTLTLQEKLKKDIQDRELAAASIVQPPPYDFSRDPPTLSSHDLDIVKLTALCAARNGRQFLLDVMQRESRNYQFDFLKPQHSLFDYFTKLIEQYTKIFLPSPADLDAMRRDITHPFEVLDRVRQRAAWYTRQQTLRQHEEEEIERERQSFASIDWHDFTIVEKIDLQPWEEGDFPPPTRPAEVGMRTLLYERMLKEQAQQQQKQGLNGADIERMKKPLPPNTTALVSEDQGEAEMEIDEEVAEADADENATNASAAEMNAALQMPPPALGQRVVRRNYDPRRVRQQTRKAGDAQAVNAEYVISPITGERIPVDKMQEHLKMSLLDPQYLEQRDRQIERRQLQEDVYAPGAAIGSSLKMIAERRDDIFVANRDVSEPPSRPTVSWDGFAASAKQAEKMALSIMNPEERKRVEREIAVATGLLPDPTKERIGPQLNAGESSGEPDAKRSRN